MPSDPALFDPLLRTLAAVPVSSQVLDLGCGTGHHTEALLRLGFPVHACDPRAAAVAATRERIAPLLEDDEVARQCVREATVAELEDLEDAFDWVVAAQADRLVDSRSDLRNLLSAAQRVLKPGGWMYLVAPAAPTDLDRAAQAEGDGAPPADATDGAPADGASASSASSDGASSGASSPHHVFALDAMEAVRESVGLAMSSAPEIDDATERVHVIYRHVTSKTSA